MLKHIVILYISVDEVTLCDIRHINITCSDMPEGYVSISRVMKLLIQGLVVNIISRFNLVILITSDILVIIYLSLHVEKVKKNIYIRVYGVGILRVPSRVGGQS